MNTDHNNAKWLFEQGDQETIIHCLVAYRSRLDQETVYPEETPSAHAAMEPQIHSA